MLPKVCESSGSGREFAGRLLLLHLVLRPLPADQTFHRRARLQVDGRLMGRKRWEKHRKMSFLGLVELQFFKDLATFTFEKKTWRSTSTTKQFSVVLLEGIISYNIPSSRVSSH